MWTFNIYSFTNFLICNKYSIMNYHQHAACRVAYTWKSVPLTVLPCFVHLPPLTCGNQLSVSMRLLPR